MKIPRMIFAVILAAFVLTAQAQDSGKAADLDALLKQVQQGRASDQRDFQRREQEFINARSEQRRILQQANARRNSEENRSEQLESTFEANEIRVSDLTQQLDRRLGSLKELFGILQQVAGDTSALFEASMTSVQYPDRNEFLLDLASKMGTSSQLASIEEIERLWFELQREMTETGRVVKFSATVITTDGEQVEREVVRVGAFNIVSDGGYLQYTAETGNLSS